MDTNINWCRVEPWTKKISLGSGENMWPKEESWIAKIKVSGFTMPMDIMISFCAACCQGDGSWDVETFIDFHESPEAGALFHGVYRNWGRRRSEARPHAKHVVWGHSFLSANLCLEMIPYLFMNKKGHTHSVLANGVPPNARQATGPPRLVFQDLRWGTTCL